MKIQMPTTIRWILWTTKGPKAFPPVIGLHIPRWSWEQPVANNLGLANLWTCLVSADEMCRRSQKFS